MITCTIADLVVGLLGASAVGAALGLLLAIPLYHVRVIRSELLG